MDKVKEILKYRFWILLGVALILPLVGWFMTRGGMIADAQARTSTLTQLTGQLQAGPDDPNNDWKTALAEINTRQQAEFHKAWVELYERQKKFMTWPAEMVDDPANLRPRDLEYYRVHYAEELEKVRQIVRPIDEFGEGVVDFPDGMLPHHEDEWRVRPPTAKEVAACQEDLWLYAALLGAVNKVNENAATQVDAPIRQIVELILRGGGGAATGGGMRPGAGAISPGDEVIVGAGPAARGGGQVGMGAMAPASVSFNPNDEFGAEQEDLSEASAGQKPGGPAVDVGDEVIAGHKGGFSFGKKALRHVVDKPEWKTRGFYMEVLMDHRKVADLLVALANADWPIRVTRIHQADFLDETLVSAEQAGPGPRMPVGGMARNMVVNPDEEDKPVLDFGGGGRGGFGGAGRAMPRPLGGGDSSAFDDHNLVHVALDGLITIYKKPTEQTPAAGTAPAGQAPATSPAAEPVATGEPAAADTPAAEDAAAEPAPGETPAAADEPPAETTPAAEAAPAAEEKKAAPAEPAAEEKAPEKPPG